MQRGSSLPGGPASTTAVIAASRARMTRMATAASLVRRAEQVVGGLEFPACDDVADLAGVGAKALGTR